MLGDSAEKLAAIKEAEGKAIGGACRHAGRAIEDCYAMNRKADKASVFAGWRDMNDYMRENKIEAVPPMSMAAKSEPKPAEPKAEKAEAKPLGEPVGEVIERRPAKIVGAGGRARDPKGDD
ncbi:MAG TPA: hypothetical protein VHQ87_02205 [Rhizobacter sp.]|nr:hypothetical protein [Rhizobacter sp.]